MAQIPQANVRLAAHKVNIMIRGGKGAEAACQIVALVLIGGAATSAPMATTYGMVKNASV